MVVMFNVTLKDEEKYFGKVAKLTRHKAKFGCLYKAFNHVYEFKW